MKLDGNQTVRIAGPGGSGRAGLADSNRTEPILVVRSFAALSLLRLVLLDWLAWAVRSRLDQAGKAIQTCAT